MRIKLAILLAASIVALSAMAADAQGHHDARGAVPARGMVAIGGSVGAAPSLEASFTNGFDLTGNIEGYLTRRVSIRAQVGGAWWDITGRGFSGTVKPVAFDGNVVCNFEGGRIHPYVTGGVGLYHYRFAETPTTGSADKPGTNVGGGVEYFVHRHATITGEVLFHATAQPLQSPVTTYNNTRYWTVTAGMKKYF